MILQPKIAWFFRKTLILSALLLTFSLIITGCGSVTSAGAADSDAAANQAAAEAAASQTIETAVPTTAATTTAATTTVAETTATTASQTVEPSKKPAAKPAANTTDATTATETAATTLAETAATTAAPTEAPVVKALSGTGKINIFMIGSDARAGLDGQRSDSMMLLTYDSANKSIKLTSFMRDTYVAIPGHGSSKMNAAFNFGGESLLIDTVRQNYAVDVEHYMTIRFEQFVAVIDQIGGIAVNLSQAEIDYINRDAGGVANGEGVKILNGAQALSHSRNRYVGNGDFTRTARQRTVVQAIFAQLKSRNDAATIAALVGFALGNVKTNVPADQILSLASDVLSSEGVGFAEARVPFDGTWSYATIKGASVIKVDFTANNEKLRQFLDN